MAAVQVEDIQQRKEHWVFADLIGKGAHIRTVPLPGWERKRWHAWLTEALTAEAAVFRAINKAGRIATMGFSPKVIWAWSKDASQQCGLARLANVARTIFGEHARDFVIEQQENLSRYNYCSGTLAYRQRNGISAANSDCTMRSTIASGSNLTCSAADPEG